MPSLIWKEWHEQSWRLGFGCLVLCALAVIGLRARVVADETMVMWVCFIGMAMLPVLSSASLVPAERSERSFESLIALPVKPWRILLAKTFMGVMLCAGPLILAAVGSVLVAGGREMSSAAMYALYGRSILAALALFIWMLALTVRLPNETRAGLLAVGMLMFWLLATAGLVYRTMPREAVSISPFGFIYRDSVGWVTDYRIGNFANVREYLVHGRIQYRAFFRNFTLVLVVQIAIATLLWTWACRQIRHSAEEKS